jgi:hypothetical protein
MDERKPTERLLAKAAQTDIYAIVRPDAVVAPGRVPMHTVGLPLFASRVVVTPSTAWMRSK